jgi:cytochrome c peroxidase
VQGGTGFVDVAATVFDHGICQGASQALDFETTWLQTVRTLNAPEADDPDAGAEAFEDNCASCHGGAKWTKSQVIYLDNPAVDGPGGAARDPGLTLTANQAVQYEDASIASFVLKFLEDVGTFDPANPIEIRQNGQLPLGALGFNVPTLLGVGDTAPYFHDGSAQTLEEVFDAHELPGGGVIADLGDADDLLAFLEALDGGTQTFRSETDDFLNPLP